MYRLVVLVPYLPLERLLVETDSPYLSPHPLRGQRTSWRGCAWWPTSWRRSWRWMPGEVARQTTQNARAPVWAGVRAVVQW